MGGPGVPDDIFPGYPTLHDANHRSNFLTVFLLYLCRVLHAVDLRTPQHAFGLAPLGGGFAHRAVQGKHRPGVRLQNGAGLLKLLQVDPVAVGNHLYLARINDRLAHQAALQVLFQLAAQRDRIAEHLVDRAGQV